MRKKIMATVLGTVMLLTAVSFTGCGRSVKDSTSTKTEKTTKETKRDEKIEIKILSKYDQIKKLLSKSIKIKIYRTKNLFPSMPAETNFAF